MDERDIYITQFDKDRLEELIGRARIFGDSRSMDWGRLDQLSRELESAHIVAPEAVPPDVVTMNSRVLLRDLDSDEEMSVALVFPDHGDIETGALSVLAPVGTAILGYRQGDVVEWPVPSGTRRIAILRVLYQPEAAGDYDL